MNHLLAFDRVRVRADAAPLTFAMDAGDIVSTRCLAPGEAADAILQVASARALPSQGSVIINGLPMECWSPLELDRCMRVLKPVACRYVGGDSPEVRAASPGLHADASILRDALREASRCCERSLPEDCEGGSSSVHQRVQLAHFLASLWTLPDGIRCVIIDGMLDALNANIRTSGLEMLRAFVEARAMAALVSCDMPGSRDHQAAENLSARHTVGPAWAREPIA